MEPKKPELPINSSDVEEVGFYALAKKCRKRALSAFFDFHNLTTVKIGRAIGKHPSRISQVMSAESAPEEIVEGLRTKIGVLGFLLPRPSRGKGKAA